MLSAAKATGEEQNQKDKQDESKPTTSYHRSTEVKSAATEQEEQNDEK